MQLIGSGAIALIGAVTAVVFTIFGADWLAASLGLLVDGLLFVWLLAVMAACAYSAIRHADHLAHLLGEPFGTLLLTLSVVIIEVALISMIMITGEKSPTLARDTMFAVLMIVLNAMVGGALIIGGLRHGQQEFNLQGARSFLAVIVPLAVIPLVLPKFTVSTTDATLSPLQASAFALFTVTLYGVFLGIQTMRHRAFFVDPRFDGSAAIEWDTTEQADKPAKPDPGNTAISAVFLVLLLAPFVALADELAHFVDYGISELGAPPALGGVLVAAVVLLPEAASALKAARIDALQRSVNICLGSALSTIGLTIPTVLVIGLITGHQVILGLDNVATVMLALTLLVSTLTFGAVRTNVLQGAVHLVLFLVFVVLILNP